MLCFRLLYATVLSSDIFDDRARAHVCVCVYVCVCVVHWHCTAQLSMFDMEKRFRNKIIIIIIIIIIYPFVRLSVCIPPYKQAHIQTIRQKAYGTAPLDHTKKGQMQFPL